MKNILIIRHAESVANAGERTYSHDKISLSEKGKIQALELAKELDVIPELIVISPFTRTQETALPFIAKHPGVPIETWEVQEFTHLDTKIHKGTTKEERLEAVENYWNLLDIHYQDGYGAETFYLFINRIKDFINKTKQRPEKTIVIFSHGVFIQSLKMYLEKFNELGDQDLNEEDIQNLMKMHQSSAGTRLPIENVSVHKINI